MRRSKHIITLSIALLMGMSVLTQTATAQPAPDSTQKTTSAADAGVVQNEDGSATPAAAAKSPADADEVRTNADNAGAKTDGKTDKSTASASSTKSPQATQKPAQIKLSDIKNDRSEVVTFWDRSRGVLGLIFLLFLCWLFSNNKKVIHWRIIIWGVALQLILGLAVMKTDLGERFFKLINGAFVKLLQFSDRGAEFLFGNLITQNVPVGEGFRWGPVNAAGEMASVGAHIAFSVLPTIIFFSSLMAVLYHSGIMEKVVKGVAWVMQKTMRTSGAETLSASGNIFVGQTEAPLLIQPYVKGMTQSELMTVMTGGFATVAGGVMAVYIGLLNKWFPDIGSHLLAASIMSAPAALVCAKLMIPEPDPSKSETYGEVKVKLDKVDVNLIDAAARGAGDGLKLALNVGAMLLAFIALIAMLNYLMAIPSYLQHTLALSQLTESIQQTFAASPDLLKAVPGCSSADLAWEKSAGCVGEVNTWLASTAQGSSIARPELWSVYTFESILGYVMQPIAWLMGVSWEQAQHVGQLLGVKTIINEFVAYLQLGGMLSEGQVTGRSAVIATYALCGFANFGSIAIQIGGIGGIAPTRKGDLAKIGLRAMIGGTIAAMMTATVAGILY